MTIYQKYKKVNLFLSVVENLFIYCENKFIVEISSRQLKIKCLQVSKGYEVKRKLISKNWTRDRKK